MRGQDDAGVRQSGESAGTGSTGSTSSATPAQYSRIERRQQHRQVDHARRATCSRASCPARAAAKNRASTSPRVSALSGVCSETTSAGLASSVSERDALDVGGEVAVDQVGVVGDDALEDVARHVRHPLADAPEADDAERELRGAAQRRPTTGSATCRRRCRGRRRRRCASTRAPAPAHAWRPRRRRSRASWPPTRRGARTRPCRPCRSPRRCGSRCRGRAARRRTRRGDRRVLQQDRASSPRRPAIDLGLGTCTAPSPARGPRRRTACARASTSGIIVVGEQDLGHRRHGVEAGRPTLNGARRAGQAPRGSRRAADVRPARTMRRHDHDAPAAVPRDDRRQPAQARLARRAQPAVGAVEARRRRARRGQARRGAARASSTRSRPGIDIVTDGEQTRRHFVHDVHGGPRGRRLRAQAHGAHPQPLRRRRAGAWSGRSRAATPIFADDARFLRAQTTRRVKFTLPGPMTMVDTLYDDALRQPREARDGVRGDPERGGARARRGGRRRRPVRRARLQRVLRRGARLGHRRAGARARRASLRRPRCTSATATASRPTSSGRRRSAASGASTSRRSRCSPPRPSTRCRSNARTRTCRSS